MHLGTWRCRGGALVALPLEFPWTPQSGQLLNASGHMEVPWKCAHGTPRELPWRSPNGQLLNASGHMEVRLWHLHGSFHGDHKVGRYIMHLGIWRGRGGAHVAPLRELYRRPPSGQLLEASGHMEVPWKCAYGTSTGASMETTKWAAS